MPFIRLPQDHADAAERRPPSIVFGYLRRWCRHPGIYIVMTAGGDHIGGEVAFIQSTLYTQGQDGKGGSGVAGPRVLRGHQAGAGRKGLGGETEQDVCQCGAIHPVNLRIHR